MATQEGGGDDDVQLEGYCLLVRNHEPHRSSMKTVFLLDALLSEVIYFVVDAVNVGLLHQISLSKAFKKKKKGRKKHYEQDNVLYMHKTQS